MAETKQKTTPQKLNSFVHHVFFYLKDTSPEGIKNFTKGLKMLAKSEHIESYHIGVPAATDRPVIVRNYTVSWCTFFKNGKAEAKYQTDPIHLKFVEEYKSMWKKVVIYDSEKI
jgi:hypothetical protein